jgi:phosphoglycerol transferase MdoB-like AlkP superfamily enzyme
MFKNKGYYASAYHNYSLLYYNRDEYMPKLGAEKYFGAKELGIHVTDKYGDFLSELQFG